MLDLGLRGKVAIITGGSDGLGRATAERLATEGCKVVICGRRNQHTIDAAKKIQSSTENSNVLGLAADVSKSTDIDALVCATVEHFGGVDILVNNAGKAAAAGLEEIDDSDWQSDIDLKLMAAVRTCRAVIPLMRDRGGGAIVNATIGGGKAPPAKVLPTTVTRAAGINLTKALANEYACAGIRVNTVCIGLIKSEQWVRKAGVADVEDFYIELAKAIPLGRVGDAEEYADLVSFLVSERAAYITGTSVNIDGGICAVT